MYFVIYTSSATQLLSEQELMDLLVNARANNSQLGVTGMLLYAEGSFLQVLEGEREIVMKLFHRIEADPRHHGVILLLQGEIEKRQFPDWSMGFSTKPGSPAAFLRGYSTFLDTSLPCQQFSSPPTRAQRLLQSFKRNHARLNTHGT